MHFSIFLVYSKSWTHADINNIGCKTHRGPALTNYYTAFGNDFNCDYFRVTASQLLLTCVNIVLPLCCYGKVLDFLINNNKSTKKTLKPQKNTRLQMQTYKQ